MREFGDWFRKSAEAAADRLAGRKPVDAQTDDIISTDAHTSDPVSTSGGGLSNVELVTGSAGTGVRTGDEDAYDSFRPGGRSFG